MKYVITFASVHFVMKAERVLKENGIEVRLIPTPRKISSDCGMSIEIQDENIERIKTLLSNYECRMERIYKS